MVLGRYFEMLLSTLKGPVEGEKTALSIRFLSCSHSNIMIVLVIELLVKYWDAFMINPNITTLDL